MRVACGMFLLLVEYFYCLFNVSLLLVECLYCLWHVSIACGMFLLFFSVPVVCEMCLLFVEAFYCLRNASIAKKSSGLSIVKSDFR